jgi:hypothetical protein
LQAVALAPVARHAERLQVIHIPRAAARDRHDMVYFELHPSLPADPAAVKIAFENLIARPDRKRRPLPRRFWRTGFPSPFCQFIRKPMNDSQRFRYLMRKCVGKRLTYAQLTAKEGETEVF